ncbi:N-acetylmuramoyl-L-alanine amidase [Cardinium endosymbiont of Nabis limbatus]|uniref:N-acetylmuramoyl-L-alanine amidase n=1 Tax=Cardinium endosymbiont of Nabis limbatus TaxID=3066217 RepID=UPI003AF331AD
MKKIQFTFNLFLLNLLGIACSGRVSYQPMLKNIIKNDYLRDMDRYPIKYGESGETTNREIGKCNNFNYRFKKTGPDGKGRLYGEAYPIYLMQHHTVADFNRTVDIFTQEKYTVSAHYVIDTNGSIYRFVADPYRAYHAGIGSLAESSKLSSALVSYSELQNDMNSWSIGIENVNNGNQPYTEAQIKSNVELSTMLTQQHRNIDAKLMLGHSDWAPSRKIDLNPYFFWDKLANAQDEPSFNELNINKNFGVYPRKKDLSISPNPDIVVSYKAKDSRCHKMNKNGSKSYVNMDIISKQMVLIMIQSEELF